MSDDIVAALRTDAAFFGKMPPHAKVDMNPQFMREMSELWIAAADEIERLRKDIAARCGDARPGAHTAGPSEHFIPEAL